MTRFSWYCFYTSEGVIYAEHCMCIHHGDLRLPTEFAEYSNSENPIQNRVRSSQRRTQRLSSCSTLYVYLYQFIVSARSTRYTICRIFYALKFSVLSPLYSEFNRRSRSVLSFGLKSSLLNREGPELSSGSRAPTKTHLPYIYQDKWQYP